MSTAALKRLERIEAQARRQALEPYTRQMAEELTEELGALERLYSAPPCRTCAGTGYLVMGVPEGIASDDPAYLPETCPECGRPVRRVLRIIGMSDEELA